MRADDVLEEGGELEFIGTPIPPYRKGLLPLSERERCSFTRKKRACHMALPNWKNRHLFFFISETTADRFS